MIAAKVKKLTIPSGSTTSNAVDVRDFTYHAFEMPATFDGATFSVEGSRTLDGTFSTVTNSAGTDMSVTATDGDLVTFDCDENAQLAPLQYLRIVSASSETAERDVYLHGR